ncbi:hypothetical protein NL364_30945, partial [Klebsiella pneumoniae]|nr:hypothetical protein [Klebsiella pneumoniae]
FVLCEVVLVVPNNALKGVNCRKMEYSLNRMICVPEMASHLHNGLDIPQITINELPDEVSSNHN